uniref:Uncharacterized protein n=1 Tax=Ciona savignyi TaxID=51511 RepID=H2Y747_CIOSA
MIQNRFSRISKASERIERRTLASLTHLNSSDSALYRRNSNVGTDELPRRNSGALIRTSSGKSVGNQRGSNSNMAAMESADKKKVRFDSCKEDFNGHVRRQLDSAGRNSLVSADGHMTRSLTSTRGSTEDGTGKLTSTRGSTDDGTKQGKIPSALDYYNTPLTAKLYRRSSLGFSHNAASFQVTQQRNSLNNTSGLEDEIHRWRRFHHNRTLNARLKAVRLPGRRHHSTFTLREAMDMSARSRKERAYRSQEFTADRAWELLNCRYLRLTPNNIKTMEDVCQEAGYDVSFHPHVPVDDTTNLKSIFKNETRNEIATQQRTIQ